MTKIETIEDLPGVGPGTADKLEEAGYKDLMSIAAASSAELKEAAGLGEATAKKAIQAAQDALEMDFETATKVLERREKVGKLTTGSKELDKLLGGGIETQAITEFYGKFGTGKTQITHQLSVNVQLPKEQGGFDGKALYIDTENTFRPERIIQMARGWEIDEKEVLENIKVGKAYNSDHQMLLAEKAEKILKDENIKLIIVDSLMSHFRSEYVGRGTLADRQQKLNRHLSALQRIAELHNVPVVVTNQVMAQPGILFGDPTAPIGGHILGHKSTFRLYLRKGKEEKRVAKLVDAPHLPDAECIFGVTEEGIRD
ncbi:MAG: DNA repair and recombination protein RadA [Candidatus Altiarchaeota archaeon]|nr:DNA repair and recombination protein RadA [Candidatus Altiarchaeota archaeon]